MRQGWESEELVGVEMDRPGTRAGLPGAEWWVAATTVAEPEHADVEIDEVERFCTEHDFWDQLI